MLNTLNWLGLRLQPLRRLLWLLLALGVVGFGVSVTGVAPLPGEFGMLFLAYILWCLAFVVVVSCFPRTLPTLEPADGLAVRLGKRLRHALVWVLGAVTVLVGLAAVLTSIRLLSIFFNQINY